MSCDTKTPYAGDDGILPHKKGKSVIGKLKSSLLSYIFVDKFSLLSVSRSKSKYEVELEDSVVSFISSSGGYMRYMKNQPCKGTK